MSNKPPKIVISGLNRGGGIPGGYVLGRAKGKSRGPAQLLKLPSTQPAAIGIPAVVGGLKNAVDDAAAATAGVAVNGFYRNGSVVMIRVA